MSYLHFPSLVFSGDFLSDVSTVNNQTYHYNNDTFIPSYQEFGKGATNGWWNPVGGAIFDFQNCTVKGLHYGDGSAYLFPDLNGLVGQFITGADGRATGKMVDLDPQQQGCSELWAIKLRITTKNNELILEGDMDATGFRDLQYRQSGGGSVNGQPLGGTWTTVLNNVKWGERAEASPFLKKLKATTQYNRLSLNLNAYGYYYNHAEDGRFSMGGILGAIGPWFVGEPSTFAGCRRLYGVVQNVAPNGQPIIYFSNSNFLFDQAARRLTFDFGSSFPIANSMGKIDLTAKLLVAVSRQAVNAGLAPNPVEIDPAEVTLIGEVEYVAGDDWLNDTCGIVSFDDLSAEIMDLLKDHQVVLLTTNSSGTYSLLARESINGYLLRADNFVQRLDAGQSNFVNFYAYQWGNPLANNTITLLLQPPTPVVPKGQGTQSEKNNPVDIPGNNYPTDGISFAHAIRTDANGFAQLKITGNAIHNPRGYLDGQIYFLDYQLQNFGPDPAEGPYNNDNIFVHLRDFYEIPENPTWDDIAYTMIQYANLYPIMSKYLVDLSDPEAIIKKKDIVAFAFSQQINDPLYMPVTRDLSENKRLTILKWLQNPIILPKKKLSKAKGAKEKELAASPAQLGKALTEKQMKLKNAVRAKQGEGISVAEFPDLFIF
jgi:hypothetical protein